MFFSGAALCHCALKKNNLSQTNFDNSDIFNFVLNPSCFSLASIPVFFENLIILPFNVCSPKCQNRRYFLHKVLNVSDMSCV